MDQTSQWIFGKGLNFSDLWQKLMLVLFNESQTKCLNESFRQDQIS